MTVIFGDLPAFPHTPANQSTQTGMDFRTYIATQIASGMFAQPGAKHTASEDVLIDALEQTERLIKLLNKN